MRIETTHRVPQAQPEVLAWYDRPGALVRLTPPGMASADDPTRGGIDAGRVVGARLGPPVLPQLLRPHWLLRHVEADPAGRFVDRQVHGPWRTWQHEHTIDAAGSGTRVTDRIDLELPAGLDRLGGLVSGAVEDQIRRLLAFRARQLEQDLAFHARHADVPRRTIAISGASGLIGTQLAALLETGGHTVRRMVRREAGEGEISWDPEAGVLDPADLEGVDAVVNLAGKSIATRWTSAARREIRASRIHGTTLIARTLARMSDGPRVLVSGSAIGYYGPRRPGELLTESSAVGEGFLAELAREWEGATRHASEAGLRVAQVRTGIVLSDAGGSLLPQLPMFLAGVGGRLADASAMCSWISLDDITRVFAHAALAEGVQGPVNGVGPEPVDAADFARTLGRVLHRPAAVPVPAFGPALLLGRDAASELVRADQNVSDARLRGTGFEPAQQTLEQALRHVLRR